MCRQHTKCKLITKLLISFLSERRIWRGLCIFICIRTLIYIRTVFLWLYEIFKSKRQMSTHVIEKLHVRRFFLLRSWVGFIVNLKTPDYCTSFVSERNQKDLQNWFTFFFIHCQTSQFWKFFNKETTLSTIIK